MKRYEFCLLKASCSYTIWIEAFPVFFSLSVFSVGRDDNKSGAVKLPFFYCLVRFVYFQFILCGTFKWNINNFYLCKLNFHDKNKTKRKRRRRRIVYDHRAVWVCVSHYQTLCAEKIIMNFIQSTSKCLYKTEQNFCFFFRSNRTTEFLYFSMVYDGFRFFFIAQKYFHWMEQIKLCANIFLSLRMRKRERA